MKKELANEDMELIKAAKDGYTVLTNDKMLQLAIKAKQTFGAFQNEAFEIMTPELAEFIRKLRVEDGYTWRAVARDVSAKTNRTHYGSNQLWGMALCDAAAKKHKEDYMDEVWNGETETQLASEGAEQSEVQATRCGRQEKEGE